MPLLPAKKQKTPACIREIQVHKLWTKVYSQKGLTVIKLVTTPLKGHVVQELCESRGGRPGLSVLTSLPVFVDVKLY